MSSTFKEEIFPPARRAHCRRCGGQALPAVADGVIPAGPSGCTGLPRGWRDGHAPRLLCLFRLDRCLLQRGRTRPCPTDRGHHPYAAAKIHTQPPSERARRSRLPPGDVVGPEEPVAQRSPPRRRTRAPSPFRPILSSPLMEPRHPPASSRVQPISRSPIDPAAATRPYPGRGVARALATSATRLSGCRPLCAAARQAAEGRAASLTLAPARARTKLRETPFVLGIAGPVVAQLDSPDGACPRAPPPRCSARSRAA